VNSFYSSDFLAEHIAKILEFYDPVVVDESGGYFQNFYDDGSLFDTDFKQLVSSARIVVNYALAGRLFNRADYLSMAQHGLYYLERVHWQEDSQTYAWTLLNHQPQDMSQQAYGYAFVLLAYAAAHKAGLIDSDAPLLRIFHLLEERFWQPKFGLYADEISAAGRLSEYRGQNSNMHLCEAMIMAFEASGDERFLARAIQLAENISQRQAAKTDGLIWEHYTADFQIDWDYNRDDPKNLYRPWGFQPGHQTEWSKLLLILHRHAPQDWMIERARNLFDRAISTAWDETHGGLIYGFDDRSKWCDDDKYFWVQAESFAAAALLYQHTGDKKYYEAYDALWQYSWDYFIDHTHGAWFRVLRRDNSKYSNLKSVAGAKCDYHTIGACQEVLRGLGVEHYRAGECAQ
jgi:mannose/cellobiose epimerase-like protein (N-acyl-D-glucosamine 2-epimerase family)